MAVKTGHVEVSTHGYTDIKDITEEVARIVQESGIRDGVVTVFIPGSTAGITTVEYEPGLLRDLPEMFEKIAPAGQRYSHDDKWHDGNGSAHVRASLVGPSVAIPFIKGILKLGTWQQVVVVDFDNRPRQREIIVQVMGE
jgi:secondary thiamine-phosphate synthase enzyme